MLKIKNFSSLCAAFVFCVGMARAQDQPLVQFQTPGAPRSLGAGSGNLGFRFSAPAPFTVSALGYYDLNGNSLQNAHEIGLFNADGKSVIHGSVGPEAPLDKDGFRYVNIKPLTLAAGTYTLSAFANVGKNADNLFARNVRGLQVAAGFAFLGGVFNSESQFKMGTTFEAANNYFGPNLKIVPSQTTIRQPNNATQPNNAAQPNNATQPNKIGQSNSGLGLNKVLKVACVGDSITYGSGIADRQNDAYPSVLQKLLGRGYIVRNFGVSGATLLKKGDKPYWTQPQFQRSSDFAPDIVLIMLGTNDTKAQNWAKKADFAADYRALIAHYATLKSHPRVFALLAPPIYQNGTFGISPTTMENETLPLIKQVGGDTINVHDALLNHPEWFRDTVHPLEAGDAVIAKTVYDALMAAQ